MKHEFAVLYGTEKNGKTKVWKAVVQEFKDKSVSTMTYGQIDGIQQVVVREYLVGKNIGKSNETSPYQQCFLETERKWKDKLEKENYSESLEKNSNSCILPMLAATYSLTKSRKKNDIQFPCMVQPKLDGLRCIMYRKDGKVKAQSRTGGFFESLSYLTEASSDMFTKYPDLVLDGELYTTEIPFETLAGLIKKKHLTDTDRSTLQKYVKYHVYDLISNEAFHVRSKRIQSMKLNPYMEPVLTIPVENQEEALRHFSFFIEKGFEGLMLRNTEGLYEQGFRSHHLQKYKEFKEEEYPIVGFEEGEGRDKGCVIWVCKTNDKEFRVRPRGTMEQRKEWFDQGKRNLHKLLTVIFQELSEQGIPRFPVGKAIRDGY